MLRIIILISFFLNNLKAQELKFFSFIPEELGGEDGSGQLEKVVSDSTGIYVFGVRPHSNIFSHKYEHPFMSKLDYSGKIIKSKLLIDSTIGNYPYGNEKMIRKSDSAYIFSIQVYNPYNNSYYADEIIEFSLKNLEIIKRKKYYDFSKIDYVDLNTSTEIIDSAFCFIKQVKQGTNRYNEIVEMDLELNILTQIRINYLEPQIEFKWVSKAQDNTYDIIASNAYWKNNTPTGLGYLTYLKVNKSGDVIKKNKISEPENLFIAGLYGYLVYRNTDRSFIIACNDWWKEKTIRGIPYVLKLSPEFDTLIWKTRFYEFDTLRETPIFRMYNLDKMKDGTGYVVCGNRMSFSLSEPQYGIISKVSEKGDSLWTRKYQPLGWSKLRAGQTIFRQIHVTPYNTIAVAARVGDSLTTLIHSWVLHLDSNGCLVPGCGEIVSTSEINSGISKAFKVFPNPIVNDNIFLLSHISSPQKHRIAIYDLNGKLIEEDEFKPQQGVQYFIKRPENIIAGEYIFKITSSNYNQVEKIIFE